VRIITHNLQVYVDLFNEGIEEAKNYKKQQPKVDDEGQEPKTTGSLTGSSSSAATAAGSSA